MRILVLGGTRFVGRHLVEARACRGSRRDASSTAGARRCRGSASSSWRGDRDTGDLEALAGRDWDVCLDVSAYLPQHVRATAGLLADRVARYAFISTASVYAQGDAAAIDEASPLHAVPDGEVDAMTGELYGPLKVACEQAVERAFPGRSLILRPGIVAGPYDPTNRFDWWVGRAGRGGEMLAPGSPGSPVQVVDGRDLARFAVDLMARQATGIFNVTGVPSTFGELLEACIDGTGTRATADLGGRATAARGGSRAVRRSCRCGSRTRPRSAPSTRSPMRAPAAPASGCVRCARPPATPGSGCRPSRRRAPARDAGRILRQRPHSGTRGRAPRERTVLTAPVRP